MKLTGRDARRFLTDPSPGTAAILLFGPEPLRTAHARKEIVARLGGPALDADMRLTRLGGDEVRRDPASLVDAQKARGFFPGPRVVLVEGAGDGIAKTLTEALEGWQKDDAVIVMTAGQLAPRSALRKAAEGAKNAVAIGIYAEPPTGAEVGAALRAAGLAEIENAAKPDIMALANVLDPGDFAQFIERLALYKLGDPAPLSQQEVAALAPVTIEAEVDAAVAELAEMRSADLARTLTRLAAQGIAATTLVIAITRHFRALHAIASDPGGPEAAIGRLRPPVFGPRRNALLSQGRRWGAARLEAALGQLMDTDLALRSGRPLPQMALLERTLIRIAMSGQRKGEDVSADR